MPTRGDKVCPISIFLFLGHIAQESFCDPGLRCEKTILLFLYIFCRARFLAVRNHGDSLFINRLPIIFQMALRLTALATDSYSRS